MNKLLEIVNNITKQYQYLNVNTYIDQYQQKPVRGIYIDVNQQFVKVSPAGYTGSESIEKNTTILKSDVYQAIVAAQTEVKKLGLFKTWVALGTDTHSVVLEPSKIPGFSKINIILDLTKPKIKLNAFESLIQQYNTTRFPLGYIPFHNNTMHRLMSEIAQHYYSARIVSIFTRKRDQCPRVYVGITFNNQFFNIKSTTNINYVDFDDIDEESYVPSTSTSKIELDL
jgi:hypothetical protein